MNELTKVQHENRSPLFDLLSTGKPTMFKAEMLGKALDKFEPYVYIVPLTNFGPLQLESGNYPALIAIEGSRAETLNLLDLDKMRLWRIGMSHEAAAALTSEIAKVRMDIIGEKL